MHIEKEGGSKTVRILEALHCTTIASTMLECLRDSGHKCQRANNIKEADHLLKEFRPSCVIIDLVDMSKGVTTKAIEAKNPEDYVGYIWAQEALKNHPELAGRIIIYSSLLRKSFGREEFENACPDTDNIILISMSAGEPCRLSKAIRGIARPYYETTLSGRNSGI